MTELDNIIKNSILGDPLAQRQLFNKVSDKILGICYRYTRSTMEAEDYFQEALIKIFNNLHCYKGEGPFDAWTRRITINVILADLKKKNILRDTTDIEDTGEEVPSEIMDHLESADLIEIINLLPESKRIIFNLYAIEGYSHKEISKQLNIKESTSRSQLTRARDLLAQLHKKRNEIRKEKIS